MGNTVNLYAHEFLIVSADEPTMRFMERHRDKFPYSYIRVRPPHRPPYIISRLSFFITCHALGAESRRPHPPLSLANHLSVSGASPRRE